MATEETPGSARKKKHRRAKSNLETQGDVSGSTDQLVSQESSRVLKARQRTQARFESFLQEAVAKDESFQETKKKKKKKRTHTSDAVLETIKYSSPITKGTSQSEENLLEANLYKEDDPSQEGKENKKSYKDLLEGSDQAALEAENADKKTPKKTKHKKTRTLTSEHNTPEDSKEKPRRRKKPKTPEPEVDGESAKENLGYENEATVEGEDTGEPSTTPAKKKGRKTRRRLLDPASADPVDAEKKRDDDGYILSATIHRADTLKPDICVSHPLVRVHLVDMNTGQYVKKSNRARSVTSYYENESDAPVDYIMPVMTQPFDFKKYKSLMPSWEEVLVFNEIFSYFLSREESDPKVIMFFEVVDFLSMTATKRRKSAQPTGKGWYQVAWAFLKIVGGNGNPNTDKKVRLQLFQPPKSAFRTPNMVEVYQWWKQAKRVPYPSTLYVTLKGVQPPKSIDPSLRSMFAIQQEKGKITFEELALDAERRAHGMRDGKTDKEPTNWTRLPGQMNRIPNKQKASLQSGKRGCFVLKFSHNGRYLACGCAELDSFPVLIYEIPSYESRARLPGHFSIIYDLCWSPDDSELLSASSDGTVRSWDMKTMMTSSIKLFPHPCFVYAAQYHPVAPHVVVTGGYDHLVRVWTKLSEGLNGKLLREIEGHEGFINSICFDEQGAKMFSADSVGIVMVWNSFIHSQVDSKRKRKGTGGYVYDWGLFRKIAIDELQRNVINSLVLHPNGHKLLVHVRNSVLCMLDLRSYTIMQRFLGASNFKEHIRSTLSTCGSFVIAGSEDGRAYVWNTETGDLVSVYTSLGYYHAVSDVQFHPLDHIIAFCSFGDSHPVLLYQYDVKAAKEETKKLMTGPVTPSKHVTTSQESTAIPDDVTRHTQMTDVASDVLRMQRVKQRLDSVLETPASPQYLDTAMLRTPGADSMMFQTPGRPDSSLYTTPATSHPGKRPGSVTFQFPATPDSHGKTFRQGMGTNASLSTWGSDFSPTAYTNYRPSSRGPSPAQGPTDRPMSPHAQQYFGASSRYESRQLFAQDMNGPHPYQTAPAGVSWMKRPSLSMSVNPGSPGPLSVTQLSGASPKPTFNFMDAPAASLLQQTPQPRRQVVAMYPYEANRADELTIQPGDIITVLLVESENWSMGQLADGRQGYFPSNYVMEQEELESEGDLQETSVPTAMPVTKQQQPKTNTQMSAVISRSGDLKIVSGPEDSSDAESKLNTSARHRRRHRQQEKTETEERTEKKPSPRRTKKR